MCVFEVSPDTLTQVTLSCNQRQFIQVSCASERFLYCGEKETHLYTVELAVKGKKI